MPSLEGQAGGATGGETRLYFSSMEANFANGM